MATDSTVFDDTRNEMACALDEILAAGATVGLIRTEGWRDDAERIASILHDALRDTSARQR